MVETNLGSVAFYRVGFFDNFSFSILYILVDYDTCKGTFREIVLP